MKQKIVVFTGSGVSAESGLKTFRESDGLWEEYNVLEVATPQAWHKNRELVLEFYNKRRRQTLAAEPNAAHYALAALEEKYDVQVITQNIDNLHERAGSKKVLHLHGIITQSRSTAKNNLVYEIEGTELNNGDVCELGSQLRPHIVWFGEEVPNMEIAAMYTQMADIFIIIGTSLNVYPAAGLVNVAPYDIPKYLIDPHAVAVRNVNNLEIIQEKASIAIPQLVANLLANI